MKENRGSSSIALIAAWFGLFLFIAAYLLISIAVGPADSIVVRDAFYSIMGVVTVSALATAAYKSRGRDKPVWILIAMAGGLWAFGDLVTRVGELAGFLGPERVLCFSDIFYLAAYASLIAIVVLLGRETEKPDAKIKWINSFPISVVVVSIIISGLLAIFLPRGVAGGPVGAYNIDIAATINYLYTALDFCILSGLLLVILVHNTHFKKVWEGLLVVGLATFSIADLSSSLFKPAGIFDPANLPTQIILAMWLMGYGFLTIAAIYKLKTSS